MNKLILFVLFALAFSGCANPDSQNQSEKVTSGNDLNKNSENIAELSPVDEVISDYLLIKNSLTNDDAKGAADAGKMLAQAMDKMNTSTMSAEQKKVFENVNEDMKEHAEHIYENAAKIDHQRSHFKMMSDDMYDMVKTFGSKMTLYHTYCPMYSDGKGAHWLSEVKEVKNPYFGHQMMDCGMVKEEIGQNKK